MYAWTTEDHVISDNEIYVKVGVTDNLHSRRKQTELLKPQELVAVIRFPHEKRSLYDNRFKSFHENRRANYGGGTEFFQFRDRESVVDIFKSIAISDDVEFYSNLEFDTHWNHIQPVEEDEVETVVPPPPNTERERVHRLPARIDALIKNACVKHPEYHQKFLELYDRSPFPAKRYTRVCNESTTDLGISYVKKARGIPIDKPPSYGENDILRGKPLDPSDIDNLLLWQREVSKIPRDDRAVNGNITSGNGNLSALIGHFMRVHLENP